MDTLSAFARGEANRGKPVMVFDWDKAAELIRERKPSVASAGLRSDWEWTGGDIYRDGAPITRDEEYTYLASTWARPELSLDGEIVECWRYRDDTPGWDAETTWPETALAIIAADS